MELNESCKIVIDKKSTRKIKCSKFVHEALGREIAVHVDIDNPNLTSITDVNTGYRLCGLNKQTSHVKMEEVMERMEAFLKHFTLKGTLEELARVEKEEATLPNTK